MSDRPESERPTGRGQGRRRLDPRAANEIAAAQLGEQLAMIVARIEMITDDLSAVERDAQAEVSAEGRRILEEAGPQGLGKRLERLEAERAEVSEHADRLRGG